MIVYKTGPKTFRVNGKEYSMLELFKNSRELRLDWTELEDALVSMEKLGHNVGYFGKLAGIFLYSKRIEN